MHQQLWFPTPIWAEDLNIDLAPLVKFTYELQAKDSGRKVSNTKGWQSSALVFDEHKELAPLKNALLVKAKECVKDYGFLSDPIINSCWINLNQENCYNISHIHNTFLSGVFYIKATKNSGLVKFTRNFTDQYILELHRPYKENILNCAECGYDPVAGRLILFPSWLVHYVEPNTDKEDRISIAFNINLTKK